MQGDEGYAQKELVAELGSAYIASWLEVLRVDKRAIFRAADYLHGLQPATSEAAE